MNIILFSRKQVNHNPEQLRTLFATIERLGLNYTINEDFATVVEALLGTPIAAEKRYTTQAWVVYRFSAAIGVPSNASTTVAKSSFIV